MTLRSIGTLAVGIALGLAFAVYVKVLPVSAQEKGPVVPSRIQNGDVNGSADIDVADVVHLLHFLFLAGPEPVPIECDDTPPPAPLAKVRFLVDPTCGQTGVPGTEVPGTADVCGEFLEDTSGDSTPSAFAEFPIPESGECEVEVSAFHPTCGPMSVCGDIPVREGYCYAIVLAVGNTPEVLYYEQTVRADGSCPPFPFGNVPPTGTLIGSFTLACEGKGGAGEGWERNDF